MIHLALATRDAMDRPYCLATAWRARCSAAVRAARAMFGRVASTPVWIANDHVWGVGFTKLFGVNWRTNGTAQALEMRCIDKSERLHSAMVRVVMRFIVLYLVEELIRSSLIMLFPAWNLT